MKCDYEGCKTMGCAQERILGLGPCRDAEPRLNALQAGGLAIAAVGIVAALLALHEFFR